MHLELRLSGSDRLLAKWELADLQSVPQAGVWMQWNSQAYLVMQRRHRYRLRKGRYQLASIALEVKQHNQPADAQWWKGRWVIGNPHCHFNARSPLLRCAVLPEGPCSTCRHFQLGGA
ncbi:MAG: DUF6464 family protein [Cyanobacteriota bacterium]|jgi:hypothetical protein